MHSRSVGVAHRDIKPGNICVGTSTGHVVIKMIDLGTAWSQRDDADEDRRRMVLQVGTG